MYAQALFYVEHLQGMRKLLEHQTSTFFFPLLTVCASFMGVNAVMTVNPEWKEPAILWNIVVARKGEKKTAAMKRLLTIVEVYF